MVHLYAFSAIHAQFMVGSCCCGKLYLHCWGLAEKNKMYLSGKEG